MFPNMREPRWTSKMWTDAARDQPCVDCGADHPDAGVVFAHMPHNGVIGGDHKCHDFWGADLCKDCHYKADHGEYRRNYEWRTRMVAKTIYRRLEYQFNLKRA